MKLKNNERYINEFGCVDELIYYPFVGEKYETNEKRILVYAHNIYYEKNDIEDEYERTKDPLHRANEMDLYVYGNAKGWNKSFRNFIKGSVGLKSDYSKNSSEALKETINNFVSKIAFTNFINGMVKSKNKTPIVPDQQINQSIQIQTQVLKILNPTHIIFWGEKPLSYFKKIDIVTELNQKRYLGKRGFYNQQFELNGNKIEVLQILHPGFNFFGPRNPKTHQIFADFIK